MPLPSPSPVPAAASSSSAGEPRLHKPIIVFGSQMHGNMFTRVLGMTSDSSTQASSESCDCDNLEERLPIIKEKWPFDRKNGLPLICCLRYYKEPMNSLLVDIFREEAIIARMSDSDSSCSYVKEGWLLYTKSATSLGAAVRFELHNILTGARLELPILRRYISGVGHACFTTISSSPGSVFYMLNDIGCFKTITLVSRPGDTAWKEVVLQHDSPPNFNFIAMTTVGTKVFCFNHSEKVSVFDLEANSWHFFLGLQKDPFEFYITEIQGEIIKLSPPNGYFSSYKFYKLLIDELDCKATWVEISRDELGKRSWFINTHKGMFSVEGGREAVYQFRSEWPHGRPSCHHGSGIKFYLDVFDLEGSSIESFVPFSLPSTASGIFWVDTGSQ